MPRWELVPSAALCLIFAFLIEIAAAENSFFETTDSSFVAAQKDSEPLPHPAINLGKTDTSVTPLQARSQDIFLHLGEFHRLEGAYTLAAGFFGILAGAILLDKSDNIGIGMACISLGGISVGFGMWEIKFGQTLLKNGHSLK